MVGIARLFAAGVQANAHLNVVGNNIELGPRAFADAEIAPAKGERAIKHASIALGGKGSGNQHIAGLTRMALT